jgi:hypothetical protein
MDLDKAQSLLTNTNVNSKIITKQTSNVSTNIENNIPESLNLSYNIFKDEKNLKNKIYDTPKLKRSQSHKRHHFKVDIGKIINEEQNEDDSENRNFLKLKIIPDKIINEVSPKTQFLIINLLSDKYYTWEQFDDNLNLNNSKDDENIQIENLESDSNESSFIEDFEKIFPHKIMDSKKKRIKKANTNYRNSISNSNSDDIICNCFNSMHSNSSNKDKIKYIPTILGRILKEEALNNQMNNE